MANKQPQRIIGESSVLSDLLDRVSLLAPINRPVLITGERGTGKELIAERLHFLSGRWDQPFLKVNCGAINENLLDADLFGYEPGAFTGANRTHQGRFERADGGTLFLDELGNMSAALQEKLLRIIEYGEFERLGGQKTRYVDVRIVAATNEDLPRRASAGHFRKDLLDRLAFDVLTLPPLRARGEDVELLAEHFAIGMSIELGRDSFAGFGKYALQQLHNHPFYGNIRELKNTVERSLYRWQDAEKPLNRLILDPFESPWTEARETDELKTFDLSAGFSECVTRYEKALLKQALNDSGGHQGKTADRLGLSYHQLRNQLKKHGLIGQQKTML